MRITAIILAVLCALNLSANVIKNGDFSAGLQHWMQEGSKVQIDPAVKFSGKNAICLTRGTELRQTVNIDANSIYELTYFVRAENISKTNPGRNGARIMLNAGKIWGRATINANGSCMTGSFDWQRGKFRIDSRKFKGGKLRIKLVLDTDGKCYFADLKLTKISSAPAKITAAGNKFFRESYMEGYPLPEFYPLGEAAGFFQPGEAAEFKLIFQPMPGLEYSLTVKNELGEKVFEQPRKPYNADEKIVIPGQVRGYYILEAAAYLQGRKIAMTQSAFVSVPAMQGKRDPFFQVNQFGILTNLCEGYRMLGVGSVVLPIITDTEGDPAQQTRKRLKRYQVFLESDFDVYAMLLGINLNQNNVNKELFRQGYPMYEHKHYQRQAAFFTEAAKLLKGKVKGYGTICEIPSHANMRHKYCGTWVEAMAQQLFYVRTASRAVRAIDPDAEFFAGGNNVQMYIDPIEKLVMTDLIDEFDVYSIDAYFGNWNLTQGVPNTPERTLRSFYLESSKLAKSLGKTPMIRNTETGYAVYYGNRYDEGLARLQAALTSRAMIISKSAPVSSVAIFRLATSYGGKFVDPYEGLMTTCWKPVRSGKNLQQVPLPGGAAYATFARELAFVKFHKEIKTGDQIIYAYIFQRPDGKTLLCPWMIEGRMQIALELAKPASHINMFGRENRLPTGVNKLTLSEEPCYIVIDDTPENVAGQVEKLFTKSRPSYKAAAKLTSQTSAMVYVANTGKEKAQCSVQGKTLEVFPDTIGNIAVDIPAGCKNLQLTVKGHPEKLNVPVISNTVKFTRVKNPAVLDGSGRWLAGKTTGKLTVPEHVRPDSALQPERNFFRSSMNPDRHNISAEYFLGYDDKNVYIAVKVDDPIHQQRYKGGNLWRDDCIQFVFATAPVVPAQARLFSTARHEFARGKNYSVALTAKGTEFVCYNQVYQPQMQANVTRKNNQTFYEAAIPWSEINSQPGKLLYFGLVVPNNDSKTSINAPYWLDMADGVCGNRDDSLLPMVIFE